MTSSASSPKPGDTNKYIAVDGSNKMFVATFIYSGDIKAITMASDRLAPRAASMEMKNLSWKLSAYVPVESYVDQLGRQYAADLATRRTKENIDTALKIADAIATVVLLAVPAALLAKILVSGVKLLSAGVAVSRGEFGSFIADEIVGALAPKGIRYLVPSFNPGILVRFGGYKEAVLRNAAANDVLFDKSYEVFKTSVSVDQTGVSPAYRELMVIHVIRLQIDSAYRTQFELGLKQIQNAQKTVAAPTFGVQAVGKPQSGFSSPFPFNPGRGR